MSIYVEYLLIIVQWRLSMNSLLKKAPLVLLAALGFGRISAVDAPSFNIESVFSAQNGDFAVKGMLALGVGTGIYHLLKDSINSLLATCRTDLARIMAANGIEYIDRPAIHLNDKLQAWIPTAKKVAAVLSAFSLGLFAVNSTTGTMITSNIFDVVNATFKDILSLSNTHTVIINSDESVHVLKGLPNIVNNAPATKLYGQKPA